MDNSNNNRSVKLERVSTIEALANAIKNDIFNGIWEPEAQITELELVERYNVSRHSIREVLVLIVNQGYLEKRMHKGVFVKTFRKKDIEDMYKARILFEEAAVKELAKNGYVPEELHNAAKLFRSRKKSDPWAIVTNSDMRFHRTLVDALGSDRISMLYSSLLVDFELINKQPTHINVDMEEIYLLHARIIDAINKGNPDDAVNALKEHLNEACQIQIEEWCTK